MMMRMMMRMIPMRIFQTEAHLLNACLFAFCSRCCCCCCCFSTGWQSGFFLFLFFSFSFPSVAFSSQAVVALTPAPFHVP